jgi:ABC-type multidrug transport system permease subunit
MTIQIARSTWIAIAVAAAAVIAVVAVVAGIWGGIGDSGMSPAGWIAMLLGVLATLGLGIGLMALVFISNRRGYDELGGPRR